MYDLPTIKAKIAKLLAKAEGTDNETEAALFMAKVEELLDTYQLELWQIADVGDKMGFDVMLEGTSSSPTWVRHLVCAVASFYGCKSIRRHGIYVPLEPGQKPGKSGPGTFDNFFIDVIGRESSRVTVQLMFPFIMGQLREAGKRLKREGHEGSVEFLTRRVANALTPRIYALLQERERAMRAPAGLQSEAARQQRALVVVHEINVFVNEQYGKLGKGRARPRSTTDAAHAAAQGISIERQVHGSGQLRLGKG